MTKRMIVEIDEEKCDGCGACIPSCAEGAIEIVGGKARLIADRLCDGLGACLGDCPRGAIRIVERDAERFDEAAVHAVRPAPAHGHGPGDDLPCGCPGSAVRMREPSASAPRSTPSSGSGLPARVNPSELAQWPIQIHLVPPRAPFFRGKELVVMSTCGPIASADVHRRWLRGRSVVVGCPKLDDTAGYAEKIGAILSEPSIPRVIVVRMEVPCCGGLTSIVEKAAALSLRNDLGVVETVVSLDGAVLAEDRLR